MTGDNPDEPAAGDRARRAAAFCADPEERPQPILSVQRRPGSLRPAIRKAVRGSAMVMAGLLALILLSFMVEAN